MSPLTFHAEKARGLCREILNFHGFLQFGYSSLYSTTYGGLIYSISFRQFSLRHLVNIIFRKQGLFLIRELVQTIGKGF